MINILSKTGRLSYQRDIERTMKLLERPFAQKMKYVLGRQYLDTARYLEMGIYNVEHIVSQTNRMIKTISIHYKQIANTMYDKVNDYLNNEKSILSFYETKEDSTVEVFWAALGVWIEEQAIEQVTKINNTTKGLLKSIVERGMREGKSLREIAKDIRVIKEITNMHRAMTIAMTETHSATVYSINKAITATGLVTEREWMNAGDERVRSKPFDHIAANGERVGVNEKYTKTGEPLAYPGDPEGSVGNIARCRCLELFLMSRKAIVQYTKNRVQEIKQRRGFCYG